MSSASRRRCSRSAIRTSGARGAFGDRADRAGSRVTEFSARINTHTAANPAQACGQGQNNSRHQEAG